MERPDFNADNGRVAEGTCEEYGVAELNGLRSDLGDCGSAKERGNGPGESFVEERELANERKGASYLPLHCALEQAYLQAGVVLLT